jgi:hypothetical protein
VYDLVQESQQLRQQVRELQNKANLDRTKAHLMRLKAGDDVVAASQELKQVQRCAKKPTKICVCARSYVYLLPA